MELYFKVVTPDHDPDWITPEAELNLYRVHHASLKQAKLDLFRESYSAPTPQDRVTAILRAGLIELEMFQTVGLAKSHKAHHKLYPKASQDKLVDLEEIKATRLIIDYLPASHHSTGNREFHKPPWRDEKTASMCVYIEQNTWWDYGANEGGSIIDFIMKLHDCDVKEAIKLLK